MLKLEDGGLNEGRVAVEIGENGGVEMGYSRVQWMGFDFAGVEGMDAEGFRVALSVLPSLFCSMLLSVN